jgi:hypothetical protein
MCPGAGPTGGPAGGTAVGRADGRAVGGTVGVTIDGVGARGVVARLMTVVDGNGESVGAWGTLGGARGTRAGDGVGTLGGVTGGSTARWRMSATRAKAFKIGGPKDSGSGGLEALLGLRRRCNMSSAVCRR